MTFHRAHRAARYLAPWLAALAVAVSGLAQAQTKPAVGDLPVSAIVPATPAPPGTEVAPVMQAPGIDTLATIRKRGRLRVGVITVEPMVMRDASGEFSGLSVDVMRRMAQEMDVGVDFIVTNPLVMIQDLRDGRFDLLATGLWMSTERAMVINFTEPTVNEGVYLVANRALAGKWRQLSDYDKPTVKIAVYSNTAQEKLARRLFPRARIVRVDGNESMVVASGDAHAALVPTLAPEALLQRAPAKLFLPRDQPVSYTPAAFGVRKGDPDFLNFLNTWLALRRGEGWLEERARHWVSSKGAGKAP
ncbi:transporter substrate-binding domain-containing protein [Rubrivivax sp. A210]|uniref:transporter substrate-binding domain-containing protein n=1 Tax=Rubrivivax sp. A210 TaxID=2772301 RepID=UPI001F48510D|nr:transporter substrate-binding domain-containing protein [Rubrivivax sp. A210]